MTIIACNEPVITPGSVQFSADEFLALYLLTCHITKLLNGEGATPASGAVGRVAQGTEGTVTAALEWEGTGGPSQAWYLQTQYGATFWQLTSRFRQHRYHAPRRDFGFFGDGSNWGGGCGC